MRGRRTPEGWGVWLLRGLRISTLCTLIWALVAVASTPVAAIYVEAGTGRIAAALDRALAAETDQQWLDRELAQALAAEPRDWVGINSVIAVADARGLHPAAPAAADLAAARARDQGGLGQAANCLACALGREGCRLADGLVCALGVELTPIGDARVIWRQGAAYATGADVDTVAVTLAVVGLGATAAVLVSGGASAPVKGGVAVLRVARRAGRLTPGLSAELARLGRGLVRWDRLPDTPRAALAPGAFRAMVDAPTLARANALSADLGRLSSAVPPGHALTLLGAVDGAADARRMSLLAAAGGERTVAAVRHLGKARALRLTARLGRAGRLLAGLALGLFGQVLALCAVLMQASLRRFFVRLSVR